MKLTVLILACLLCFSCRKADLTGEKHYALTGKVVSLDAKDRTAAVDAAAIPNFMEAMTMDYPIESKAEFDSLHKGDQISATVDVSPDGIYALSHIKTQPATTK